MTEIELYSEFLRIGMTPAGAAGCVANVMAESAGRADNLQDSYNRLFGVTDAEYVQQVDKGIRGFQDSAGFGYCQWTANSRKAALKLYLDGHGKSIADSDGQIQFMAREMRSSYAFVWNRLTASDDPYECGYVMCKFYEIPADTERQAQMRGEQAKQIYQRCSGTVPATEPKEKTEQKEVFWPPRMLCKGMNGADVTVLQALLVAHGYGVTAVNGVFSESTDKAVKQYQTANNLDVDGIAGNQTFSALLKR